MNQHFLNFTKGMLIGAANIIPGVSGGTIAIILGIFDQLIDTINHFTKDIKKNIVFILPIALGAAFSIVALSSVLNTCLEEYSFQTSMFFVGLVCGSIPLIYKKSVSKGFRASYILYTLISIAIVIGFSTISRNDIVGERFYNSYFLAFQLFFGGLFAAAAMVIPGISGSFIMMLMGIYPMIIQAVSSITKCIKNPSALIDFGLFIAPLGAGIICGILLISKLISFLMNKFYSVTYFSILGLIIGSIYGIFASYTTYQSGVNNVSIIIGIITFIFGCLTSYFLGERN